MKLYFKVLAVLTCVMLTACGAQDVELNVKMSGEGTVTSPAGVDCSESCVATVNINPPRIGNKYIKITATPASGYEFLGWNHHSCTADEVCDLKFSGLCIDQALCLTGTMYSDESVQPVFVNSSLLLDSGWSERAVCAAFGSGEVQCWGSSSYEEVQQVPALNNPQMVTVAGNSACALVDEGIRCWGAPNLIPQDAPVVYPPLEMEMLAGRVCVLDQEALKCWGTNGVSPTPEFTNPTNLHKRKFNTPEYLGTLLCVDDEGEEVCW